MPIADVDTIQLYYETFGDPANPAMLLIMGLGMQLTAWDEALCRQFARRGFFVIRFDNRDVGLSTKLPLESVYGLDDLAADAVGLLDALDIGQAHVVGASMGGMVAQVVAINYPQRVLSLASMLATTGDISVGQPRPDAVAALTATPVSHEREDVVAHAMASQRVIGSPAFPMSDRRLRAFVERNYDRSYRPEAVARHLMAVLQAFDRTDALRGLRVPTVVIHGVADVLIDISGGEATAKAIAGAELVVIDGLGHDLPAAVWPQIIDAVVANAARSLP